MFKKSLSLSVAFALVLTLGQSAFAATTPAPMDNGSMRVAGSTPLVAVEYRAVAYGERASKLIGSTVYNDQHQAVGKVSDLIISPADSVSIVVVAVGGFLGLGAKDVALSAKSFDFHQKDVVLHDATKAALEKLPPFHYSR